METREDKGVVTFWFIAYSRSPSLGLAISSLVQGAVQLIADKMRLRYRFERDDCDMDLGVTVPLRRVNAFYCQLVERGIPVALCGTVDCPTESAATRLRGMGFESEIIE